MRQEDFNEHDLVHEESSEECCYDENHGWCENDWTDEDSWWALTDGMYDDYTDVGDWDSIYDIMGL